MQASRGMLKHGIPSNSGAVQGYRYNARVLARYVAESLGKRFDRPRLRVEDVGPYVLREASRGPELWHQRSYLSRVLTVSPDGGMEDMGIEPLAHFVDDSRSDLPDGVAVALEHNGRDDPYPALYVRTRGKVSEHLLAPHPLLDFEGDAYQREAASVLKGMSERAMSGSKP